MLTRLELVLKRVKKKLQDQEIEEIEEEIRSAFVVALPQCPENMLHDIVTYFTQKYVLRQNKYTDYERLTDALIDFYHLMEAEYDEATAILDREDFSYLSQVASDFALEMEDKVLFIIMAKAVEKQAL